MVVGVAEFTRHNVDMIIIQTKNWKGKRRARSQQSGLNLTEAEKYKMLQEIDLKKMNPKGIGLNKAPAGIAGDVETKGVASRQIQLGYHKVNKYDLNWNIEDIKLKYLYPFN